ncbi:MAG: DNA mismatch repair endonuclease MutL [Akkermansiaceae bacterium]
MSKIQILDDILASQVAAGEVVERPASVVKELVENSLDAGASHITVEIHKGGTALIRVTDDACGMDKEDALMSLERHATSKLRTSHDLSTVMTLGFRGEAVPSIASVGRFRMATRERGSVAGTEVFVDGGVLKDVRDAGVPEGTCMEVKQIFFNVPARRKFLKAETTESAHVEHQVRLHALASPEVRFTFLKDGRPIFDLAGTPDWRVRISGLSGAEIASKLIEVGKHAGIGMFIRGYLLPADYARRGRKQQFIFLNGRPVEDSAISRALKDGFRGAVPEGSHPAAWLWIEMDPTLVDVNVHPAKKEVRFHRPHDVRSLIESAVTESLAPKPVVIPQRNDDVFQPVQDFQPTQEPDEVQRAVIPSAVETSVRSETLVKQVTEFPHRAEQQEELATKEGKQLIKKPDFRLIGPLHDRYIVMEGDEGVVLLDPIAARERVVYEYLLKNSGGVDSQGLLVPELLELEALDAELVVRHESHFADAGMAVESFGGSTVKVSSLPSFLKVSDVRGFLIGLVDELSDTLGGKRGKSMAYETFAANLASRAGRNEPCRIDHAEPLLNAMFKCDLPYCTPDGRPTLIHISLNELDRKFGK